jgi:hypothetical protein
MNLLHRSFYILKSGFVWLFDGKSWKIVVFLIPDWVTTTAAVVLWRICSFLGIFHRSLRNFIHSVDMKSLFIDQATNVVKIWKSLLFLFWFYEIRKGEMGRVVTMMGRWIFEWMNEWKLFIDPFVPPGVSGSRWIFERILLHRRDIPCEKSQGFPIFPPWIRESQQNFFHGFSYSCEVETQNIKTLGNENPIFRSLRKFLCFVKNCL